MSKDAAVSEDMFHITSFATKVYKHKDSYYSLKFLHVIGYLRWTPLYHHFVLNVSQFSLSSAKWNNKISVMSF